MNARNIDTFDDLIRTVYEISGASTTQYVLTILAELIYEEEGHSPIDSILVQEGRRRMKLKMEVKAGLASTNKI